MVLEIIRYQTPVLHLRRTTLEDTELDGQVIAKGDKVAIWYISTNFDETVFESPGDFIIDRKNARRHLSFGVGIHRCVGDRLAELQILVLWEEILKREISIEIVGPAERIYSKFIRGFSTLPVRINS
jgi:cytochrome P450